MNYPLMKSSTDFQSVRDGILSLPLHFDIDLSIARSKNDGTASIFDVAGNSMFQDQDVANGGVCKITFQHRDFGISDPAFTSAPGFQANVPFTRVVIENAAQAGKTARIFYGVDLDFKPGSVGVVQITGGVSIAQGSSISESSLTSTAGTLLLLAANPLRKRFIVRNAAGVNTIYLNSGPGVAAASAIIVGPGEVWIETDAAAAEWYFYAPAAGVPVHIQEAF